ncbi:MAG: Gfo/Idh/MocA family protein [Nitrospinota bacterium]
MALEAVRVASVGLGRWASVLADAIGRGGKLRLVNCFTRDPSRRRAFAERYRCRESASLEALVADPEVEGVILTTPNHLHAEHAEMIAAGGKHLYVEKPIAHTLQDARRVERACREAGVVLAVGHSARRLAVCGRLKGLLESGELGEVNMAESNFSTERGLELTPEKWRYHQHLNPTGALIQLGIHHADTYRYLLGPIVSVTARLKRLCTKGEVEDTCLTILEHAGGQLTYVGASWASPWAFYMQVYGGRANARFRLTRQQWQDPSCAPEPIRLFVDREPLGEDTFEEPPGGDMFRDTLEDFAECVREGREPEVNGAVATEALAVVFAAHLSSQEGRTVELRELL